MDIDVNCLNSYIKGGVQRAFRFFFEGNVNCSKYLFQILLICFIVIGVYYPSIFNPFNSVDDLKMINNLLNLDNFSINQIFIPKKYGQYYRPILYLTFISDKFIWGLEASFMHLENILLHLCNSLLVLWVTRQIIYSFTQIKLYTYIPLVTSLMFGLHPIATEPVNWVSGRTDLLAGFFVLMSFGIFLVANKQGLFGLSGDYSSDCLDNSGIDGTLSQVKLLIGPNAIQFILGLIGALMLLAGCLSKETAFFFLPIILAWCIFPPKNSKRVSYLPCHKEDRLDYGDRLAASSNNSVRIRIYIFTAYSCAGAAYLLLRWMALSGGDKIVKTAIKVSNSTNIESPAGIMDLFFVVLKSAGFYFKKLFIPVPLNFGINGISSHYFWLGLLVFIGVAWCISRRDIVSYLFFAAFSLTSSAFLLPILKITWTPIAERYLYVALAPFLIGLTILYTNYISERFSCRFTTIIVATVLGCAAVVTVQRNIIWQDNFTLFEDTLKKSTAFGAIMNEYAFALRTRGRTQEADSIMLSNVVEGFQPSSLNKVSVIANQGKLVEARLMLMERLEKPSDYDILSYELLLKIDEMRREKAISDIEKLKIDRDILIDILKLTSITGDPFYYYRLGVVQLRLDDKKSAKESFKKAYQNSPPNSHYSAAAKKLAERL